MTCLAVRCAMLCGALLLCYSTSHPAVCCICLQMDSRRNHIIMVNLWLSMLNISVMATTVLPAFFGMNLDNGLAGDDPRFFMLVSHTLNDENFNQHDELCWQRQGLRDMCLCTHMLAVAVAG